MTDVPPFWCPADITSAVNPAAEQAERETKRWGAFFGIKPYYADIVRSATFMGRFAPTAPLARLKAISCWNSWGFAFDDYLDTRLPHAFPVVVATTQRALTRPHPPVRDDPWSAALQDVGNQLRDLGSSTQFRRFVDSHRAWLFAACWRHSNHVSKRLPSLDEYVHLREQDSAGESVYHLVALAERIHLSDEEIDAPPVRAMLESAVTVLILDNDRHSFQKEDRERPSSQHLFSVLMRERGLGLTEALRQGVALRDRILRLFLVREQEVETSATSADLIRFAQLVKSGIRAHLDWASESARYSQAKTSFAVCDTPSDDTLKPPPDVPSIAWWWYV
ncbi:hypothetical protein FHR84_000751 [Actinopolyspora biskrensis]|uniref:Terpene synthase n=1 Tax=Actinopolyspora biskrensis TaxID=1470178 RepID=A0A852Z4Y2_9ACTN|nr:terpene synthase family protein [Actinopolyspora biskrensis]NYH77437.1 hypothetical protein [Actinopolyspora biskrensis]